MNKFRGLNAARILRLARKILNGQILVTLFPEVSFKFLKRRYQSYIQHLAAQNLPLVLRIEYGGLGDHLTYSALPEALLRRYGVRTDISLRSAFNSTAVKDFVWGDNPAVSFSSDNGRSFSTPHIGKYRNYNEVLLALFDLNGPLFSLHYRPVLRPEVSEKVVCDLTAGPSSAYNAFRQREFWDAVLKYLTANFKKEELVLIEPKSSYPDKRLLNYVRDKLEIPTVSTDAISDLVDILFSAKGRVLLDSGAKSLAAAYGKPSVVLVRGFINKYFSYATNHYVEI